MLTIKTQTCGSSWRESDTITHLSYSKTTILLTPQGEIIKINRQDYGPCTERNYHWLIHFLYNNEACVLTEVIWENVSVYENRITFRINSDKINSRTDTLLCWFSKIRHYVSALHLLKAILRTRYLVVMVSVYCIFSDNNVQYMRPGSWYLLQNPPSYR